MTGNTIPIQENYCTMSFRHNRITNNFSYKTGKFTAAKKVQNCVFKQWEGQTKFSIGNFFLTDTLYGEQAIVSNSSCGVNHAGVHKWFVCKNN